MINLLVISDITFEPIAKAITELHTGKFRITCNYSEDVIATLLSITRDELDTQDVVFIHSDQIFHRKEQSWQKSLLNAVAGIANSWKKSIIVSNSLSQSFDSLPVKSSLGYYGDLFSIYSSDLSHLLEHSNIYIFDFLNILTHAGIDNVYNYNLGHLYQMPYTKIGIKHIAEKSSELLLWLFAEEKKAIIVDCDNTLWKGIIGEDGIDGIKCDKNAEGIVYYNFQSFLKAKQKEGFLLCICSKNNETDVKEVFEKKKLPLKWNDFIIKKINWDDKITNIQNIAKELNIGTDSFIFIDDNLFEINSVSTLLNGIACMPFTDSYANFLNLANNFHFKRRQILEADKKKTEQYETELLRKKEETNFTNLDDFINSLNLRLDIRLNDLNDLERLSQMTAKTNQFNFNKKAYTVDELLNFINSHNKLFSLKLSDKYGDYGTVGMMLINISGKTAIIDNYLMSCRALGKGVEKKFYYEVLNLLSKEKLEVKEIRFNPTEKNLPAQQFFNQLNV